MGKKAIASTYEEVLKVSSPTVEVIGSNEGRNGGKLLLLKRTGKSWGSSNVTPGAGGFGYDMQGDPRWFIETLGEEGASRFGFRVIDETTMTVPDFKEFTGAIDKINAKLAEKNLEPISIKYYATADNDNVLAGKYVDHFLDNRAIPIAPSGNHFVHDMSFHSGAIYLPKELLNQGAARVEYRKRFAEFLKKKSQYGSEDDRWLAKTYSYWIKFWSVTQVDYGTAMLGPQIAAFLKQNPEATANEMKDYLRPIITAFLPDLKLRDKFTPIKHLQNFRDQMHHAIFSGEFDSAANSANWYDNVDKIRAGNTQFDRDMRRFSKSYRSRAFPDFNPNKPMFSTKRQAEDYLEKLCQSITERRKQIRQAALETLK
ncbi:MAG: hypothetical protein ACXWQO_16180 [Bdellovibrionota bacterium]